MWHVLSLIVLIQVPIYGGCEKYCPWGGVVTSDCSVDECNIGDLCTKWIVDTDNMNDKNSLGCCDMYRSTDPTKYCSETGMFSAATKKGESAFTWRWPPIESEDRWYKKSVEIGGKKIDVMCPLPHSYSLYDYIKEPSLAVGFKIDGEPVPRCKTSDDCKDDEFCDAVINLTFLSNKKLRDEFLNHHAIDRSNPKPKSKPLQFCFKNRDFGSRLHYVKEKQKKTGIPNCNENSDCFTGTQKNAYCHKEEQTFFVNNDIDNFHRYKGLCLQASICAKESHVSEYGSLGSGGKFCDVNDPSTCPPLDSMANSTITPTCVSAYKSDNYTVSLCCYPVPETTTTTTMVPATEPIKSYSAYYQLSYTCLILFMFFPVVK